MDPVPSYAPMCGRVTRTGAPCSNKPMARNGPCHRHAGLPSTPAERAASRKNRSTHGLYARGLLDEEDASLFARVFEGEEDPQTMRRETIAILAVRASRAIAYEAAEGKLIAQTPAALQQLLRALPPEPVEEGPPRMDEGEFVRKVEQTIAKNVHVLIKYLPEHIRTVVAPMMREYMARQQAATSPGQEPEQQDPHLAAETDVEAEEEDAVPQTEPEHDNGTMQALPHEGEAAGKPDVADEAGAAQQATPTPAPKPAPKPAQAQGQAAQASPPPGALAQRAKPKRPAWMSSNRVLAEGRAFAIPVTDARAAMMGPPAWIMRGDTRPPEEWDGRA